MAAIGQALDTHFRRQAFHHRVRVKSEFCSAFLELFVPRLDNRSTVAAPEAIPFDGVRAMRWNRTVSRLHPFAPFSLAISP